jgi:hypothetical protein
MLVAASVAEPDEYAADRTSTATIAAHLGICELDWTLGAAAIFRAREN